METQQHSKSTALGQSSVNKLLPIVPYNKKTSGSSVVEIVVAIAIFMMVVGSIIMISLAAYGSSLRDKEKLQAQLLLQEGLEAVRSIRDYNFTNLTNGSHGLSDTNGYWEFSGASNVIGQFTRTITVESVFRTGPGLISNSNCSIASSGGIEDQKTKKITVTVNWDLEAGKNIALEAAEYLPDWENQQGCGESSWLSPDLTATYITNSDKTIGNIVLRNTGSGAIRVNTITPSWTNGAMMKTFTIGGNTLWQYSEDPEHPVGKLSSGTTLTANYTIGSGGTVIIDNMTFDSAMTSQPIEFLIAMNDSTGRYFELSDTPGEPPAEPEESESDTFNMDSSHVDLSSGNKTVDGIEIENTSDDTDITIDKMTVSWSGGSSGNKLSIIQIDGDTIWKTNISSGTEANVDNYELHHGQHEDLELRFTKSIHNATLNLIFKFSDGSVKSFTNIHL